MRPPPDCRPSVGASAPKGTCRWLSPFGGSVVRTALNYNYHRAAGRILCRRLKYATGYSRLALNENPKNPNPKNRRYCSSRYCSRRYCSSRLLFIAATVHHRYCSSPLLFIAATIHRRYCSSPLLFIAATVHHGTVHRRYCSSQLLFITVLFIVDTVHRGTVCGSLQQRELLRSLAPSSLPYNPIRPQRIRKNPKNLTTSKVIDHTAVTVVDGKDVVVATITHPAVGTTITVDVDPISGRGRGRGRCEGIELKDKDKKGSRDQYCIRLNKSLYGLKQSGRMWYNRLSDYLVREGYKNDPISPCIFIKKFANKGFVIIAVYVDDLNILGTSGEIAQTVEYLKKEFEMKDLGKTKFCLGLQLEYVNNGILVHQKAYTEKVLKRFNMDQAHPLSSPMVVRSLRLDSDPFGPKKDEEEVLGPEVPYLSAIGALMYLASHTRPDIYFAVNLLCLNLAHVQPKGTGKHDLLLTKTLKSLTLKIAATVHRGTVHAATIHRGYYSSPLLFIAVTVHRRYCSSRLLFIAATIHRRYCSSRLLFIAATVNRRYCSSPLLFITVLFIVDTVHRSYCSSRYCSSSTLFIAVLFAAHPLSSPMVVRSLGLDSDSFGPKKDEEEVLGPEVPYLSAIGALMNYVWLDPFQGYVGSLLQDAATTTSKTIIFGDNTACIAQLKDGYIKGDRTKHILPKFFFTHDLQRDGEVRVVQVRSSDNSADLFTKALPTSTLRKLTHQIGMRRLKDLQG
ncbi:Reverse transcriptase RNA-dependent DNA polymerase [Arabidopsis suecica]|uniref:Reverse transcriptase RNA-dependent DNA polymerase n=1 Tax=Arabidopsis suecica TaxID=45249 RepID=A0A8T1X894_ARASU|nr:Reverse transcriptase RNA-dependent DNA polymerase [Arabidopsis suecica]